MEKVISVVVFFYLALFLPIVFSNSLIVILLFFFLSILSLKIKKLENVFLLSLLLYLLFARGFLQSNLNLSFQKENIIGIYCKAISEPNSRNNRKKGFKVMLLASLDKNNSISSSSGIVYVITEDTDIHIFDNLFLTGFFLDDLFIANSTAIVEDSVLSRGRNRIITWIRGRTREGEIGELMQMLLLGSGENGTGELSSLSGEAGLRHVLALSGMHLVVIVFLLKPLSFFQIKSRYKLVISFVVLLAFTSISGWRPSLLRAFIFLFLIKLLKDIDSAFVLSAIVLLFIFPYYGFDLASIYSFISLGGILLFSDLIDSSLSLLFPKSRLLSGISASISAQLTSIPISYFTFGSYQLLSIVFSFHAGLLISIYMALSLFYIAFPAIKPIMNLLYFLISKVFEFSSFIPPSNSIKPYKIMVAITIVLISILKIIERAKKKGLNF